MFARVRSCFHGLSSRAAERARRMTVMWSVNNHDPTNPGSQYFCCMVLAIAISVRKHPAATKRALRGFLKRQTSRPRPQSEAVKLRANKGTRCSEYRSKRSGNAYDRWREYDPEDTVRFFCLRLHEAGLNQIKPAKNYLGRSES